MARSTSHGEQAARQRRRPLFRDIVSCTNVQVDARHNPWRGLIAAPKERKLSWIKAIAGGRQGWRLERYRREARAIAALEPGLQQKTDGQLRELAAALKGRAADGEPLAALRSETYALGREVSRRVLGLRPFDVQILGALALHDGLVAEMKTGEGKTLVATLPALLNSLSGRGVHVVTVNDFLARRDAAWMGPLYTFLGLSVGVIQEQLGQDAQEETTRRRAAYACDITYGTNHELAFDYLRDNLATSRDEVVHRGFDYAIVDEVDFLLIDEARTPLIISGPAREATTLVRRIDRIVRRLEEGYHYQVEPKTRAASLTDAGLEAVQSALGVDQLYTAEHLELYHAARQAVLAHGVYRRDVDYVVRGRRVLIVDEFTGRISEDKRYADGLHQALEAKEGLKVRSEDLTLAKVTYQTFFGRYRKLCGMTGTAWTEREELKRTYNLDVLVIPTHRPMIRLDYEDLVFDTLAEKHAAIVEEILELRRQGRPVLVGTTSVRESEQLSARLQQAAVAHAVLNAKNHEAEARVVAQAGRRGAVTISTNMAGRGIDILLGGNPDAAAAEEPLTDQAAWRLRCEAERREIITAGGLHVIGTSRHESPRIDNQLRGRAGRQGDPGSTQFIICLDDPIWRKFGRTDIEIARERLHQAGHQRGSAITAPAIQRLLRSLQHKVEEENRAIRKDVLKYDLVVHLQRETIYSWRQTLVSGEGWQPEELVAAQADDLAQQHNETGALQLALQTHFHLALPWPDEPELESAAHSWARAALQLRELALGQEAFGELGRQLLLSAIDELWTDHLSNLERLEEGIGLRGYGAVDPVLPWRQEATEMWQLLLYQIRARAVDAWFAATRQPGD